MFEELITALVVIDVVATLTGNAVLWKKLQHLDSRLTILETKYQCQVTDNV